MPPVAATRSPSKSATDRSSSATGEGSSRNGPVGSSANTSFIARMNVGYSARVIGRSRSAMSVTRAVYRAGPTFRQRVLVVSGAGGHAVLGQRAVPAGDGAGLVGQRGAGHRHAVGGPVASGRAVQLDDRPLDGALPVAGVDHLQ